MSLWALSDTFKIIGIISHQSTTIIGISTWFHTKKQFVTHLNLVFSPSYSKVILIWRHRKTKQKNRAYIFNVKQTKRKKKKERQLIITGDYEHPSSNNKTECLDVLLYSMSGRINSFFSLLIVFFRQTNTIYLWKKKYRGKKQE